MNSEERASIVMLVVGQEEVRWISVRSGEGIPYKGHDMSKGEPTGKIFTEPSTSLEHFI